MTAARATLFLLSFVLPVALWTGSTSYESAKFLAWALAAATWLLLYGAAIARRCAPTAPPRAPGLAAFSLWMIMLPGLWCAMAPLLVARAMFWTAIWALTALVTSLALRDGRDLRRLLWWATGGVALVCAGGLLQIMQVLPGPGEWDVPAGISTLGNENYVAELAAVWLAPSLLLAWGARRMATRMAACIIVGLLLAMLVASSAAGARVGALAAIAFAAGGRLLERSRWKRRTPVVLAVLCLAGAALVGLLTASVMASRYHPETDTSWTSRLFADNHGAIRRTDWLVARELWKGSPLLGCGAGNYGVHWPATRAALTTGSPITGLAEGAPVATRAHHEYLQLAAELGWAGVVWLAAVLVAAAAAWSRRWPNARDKDSQHAQVLLAAGVVAAAVIALVSFPMHLPASALALAILVGALASSALGSDPAGPARNCPPRWTAIIPVLAAAALAAGAVRAFHGDVLVARGTRLFVAGTLEPAIAPLQKGIALSPWPDEARLYLGLALAANEQPEEALRMLATSLRDRPSFEAYLAMAEIHLDARRFDLVAPLLDDVDRCRPATNLLRQVGYLRALMSLRSEHWHEARARFERLVRDDRTDHRSWLGLGYLDALQGDVAGAAACYGEAIAALETLLSGDMPATAEARGQIVRWRAQLETARRALASVTD